jgi:hypothetical protein
MYHTHVEITKYHLKGILAGQHTTDNMDFVDWHDACKWAGGVTMNLECPYVVLEMRDINTGVVQNF